MLTFGILNRYSEKERLTRRGAASYRLQSTSIYTNVDA